MNYLVKYWKVKTKLYNGTDYDELYKKAWVYFLAIRSSSKRKTYIRSTYFEKRKVFFDFFWLHLKQKNKGEQKKRLPYFRAGIEVVENSTHQPNIYLNKDKSNEIYFRFYGYTNDQKYFVVQIKEIRSTKTLQLMSIYPIKKSPAG